MATKVYTLGLSKIEVGDPGTDGSMATSLETVGYTYQDTAQLSVDDPTTTDFYAEEVDDPVVSISRAGNTKFAWSIMNPDVSVLQKFLGGTADTTANTWKAPNTTVTVEKSVKITPQQGLIFAIPRMKIDAKLQGALSKNGMVLLEVTGTVLTPANGDPKMTISLVSSTSSTTTTT